MSPTVVLTWASAIRTFSGSGMLISMDARAALHPCPPKITGRAGPPRTRPREGRAGLEAHRDRQPRACASCPRSPPRCCARSASRCRRARSPRTRPGRRAPQAALAEAEAALDPEPGAAAEPTRDVTLALRDLSAALPRLDGAERRRATRLLARPTDSPDPYGDTWKAPEAPPLCSTHFCVHYVASTDDAPNLADVAPANGIPDFVEIVVGDRRVLVLGRERAARLAAAEARRPARRLLGDRHLPRQRRAGRILRLRGHRPLAAVHALVLRLPGARRRLREGRVRLRRPRAAAARDARARVQPRASSTGSTRSRTAGCSSRRRPGPRTRSSPPTTTTSTTSAPSPATPGTPMTQFDGAGGLKIYGAATFQHWLDRRIRRPRWSSAAGSRTRTRRTSRSPPSTPRSASRAAAVSSPEFAQFAAATAEWRSAGGFPDAELYPDVKRQGKLSSERACPVRARPHRLSPARREARRRRAADAHRSTASVASRPGSRSSAASRPAPSPAR